MARAPAPGRRLDEHGPRVFWEYRGEGHAVRYHWGHAVSTIEADPHGRLLWDRRWNVRPRMSEWERLVRWWRVATLQRRLASSKAPVQIVSHRVARQRVPVVRLPTEFTLYNQEPFDAFPVVQAIGTLSRGEQEQVHDVLRELGLLRWEPPEEVLAEGPGGSGLTPPTPWLLTVDSRPAAPGGVVAWRDLVLHLYDADRLEQLGHYRVKVAENETRIRVAGWLVNLTHRRVRGVGSLLYDWLRELYPTVPVEHPGQTEAGKRWWTEYCRRRGYDPADPYA